MIAAESWIVVNYCQFLLIASFWVLGSRWYLIICGGHTKVNHQIEEADKTAQRITQWGNCSTWSRRSDHLVWIMFQNSDSPLRLRWSHFVQSSQSPRLQLFHCLSWVSQVPPSLTDHNASYKHIEPDHFIQSNSISSLSHPAKVLLVKSLQCCRFKIEKCVYGLSVRAAML